MSFLVTGVGAEGKAQGLRSDHRHVTRLGTLLTKPSPGDKPVKLTEGFTLTAGHCYCQDVNVVDNKFKSTGRLSRVHSTYLGRLCSLFPVPLALLHSPGDTFCRGANGGAPVTNIEAPGSFCTLQSVSIL